MQSDRELVELAAKALGAEIKGSALYEGQVVLRTHEHEWTRWCPLDDDGDALRLAVDLRLRFDAYDDQVETMDGCEPYKIGPEEFTNTFVCIELPSNGHYAATRRAIVRAAAKLGESK